MKPPIHLYDRAAAAAAAETLPHAQKTTPWGVTQHTLSCSGPLVLYDLLMHAKKLIQYSEVQN